MLTHRRPIYLEVLQDVWSLPCAAPGATRARRPVSEPASLAAALDAAWERMQAAKLPVLWAGIEIQRFGLQDTLQAIVDASGAYFTTTSLAKTVLDESQPQFIGTYAGPASPAITRAVMKKSDCVIALGTIITDDYLDIMTSGFGSMIEVTVEETRIGYQYYRGVALADFLDGLLARLRAGKRKPAKYALPRVATEKPAAAKPGDGLTYTVFFEEIAAFLKKQGLLHEIVLVLGESTSLYVFGNLFGLPRNASWRRRRGARSGHETGCALGVALGSGKRPVVVAGDGGFMMVCQELSSLARQK